MDDVKLALHFIIRAGDCLWSLIQLPMPDRMAAGSALQTVEIAHRTRSFVRPFTTTFTPALKSPPAMAGPVLAVDPLTTARFPERSICTSSSCAIWLGRHKDECVAKGASDRCENSCYSDPPDYPASIRPLSGTNTEVIQMALVFAQYGPGGPEVMRAEERDIGAPTVGLVKIEQKAIGFNYFDTLQRSGLISRDEPGRVMGIEGAGVVVEVGPGVEGFAVGDRVGYLRSQGAYAESRLIEADLLFHLPQDVSFEIAAALTVKGFMAWLCACRLCEVHRDQIILVTTAAGGVGSFTSRLSASRGARVIGVVGSNAKRGMARVSGAADVAVGLDDAFELVAQLTDGLGVDAVFDGIGADAAERLLAAGAVRSGGTIISFGASGGWPKADPEEIARRGVSFSAPQALTYLKSAGELRDAMAKVFQLYRDGAFGDVPLTRYLLRDAVRLHREVDRRTISGISVLVP